MLGKLSDISSKTGESIETGIGHIVVWLKKTISFVE